MQTQLRSGSTTGNLRAYTKAVPTCLRRSLALRCCASNEATTSGGRRQTLSMLGAGVVLASGIVAMQSPAPALAKLADYNIDPNSEIEEVNVTLGTTDGKYMFTPNTLEFTQGRIYKLKMNNPSTSTHYFTALEFADKIYTLLVLAGDPVVEVKGAVQEIALKAGASATWVFMPIKPGKYPLKCTVKGHDGMLGTIVVKKAAA